jgi:hypothetical protein
MSDSIQIIFTKRKWNPFSWLIRWALPRSRFSLALASHSIIVDGAYAIEAHMLYGVRRVLLEVALEGLTEVARRDYAVPDAQGGIEWARKQVRKGYDWKGAFGLPWHRTATGRKTISGPASNCRRRPFIKPAATSFPTWATSAAPRFYPSSLNPSCRKKPKTA